MYATNPATQSRELNDSELVLVYGGKDLGLAAIASGAAAAGAKAANDAANRDHSVVHHRTIF